MRSRMLLAAAAAPGGAVGSHRAGWSMAPVVEAYQAMRGASFLVAVTFAAEIGDVRRFDNPRS